MPRLARIPALVAGLVLCVWIFWLRSPSFGHAFWNLDEGIYATIGREITEGSVMYRDVIDDRGPVCHYLVAALFAVVETNRAWAMHAALAGLVVVTAFGIFLLGRDWRDTMTGAWAAAIFAAFSTDLFYVGDAYAVSTEWFVACFSVWSTWWFWRQWPRAGFWGPFVAGVGYALAFLSKQPGLLEVGPALVALGYLAGSRRLTWMQAARIAAGLVAGFTTLTAAVFAYFWLQGALADFYFYGWTFPLVYYSAQTTLADRFAAAFALPRLLANEYPLMLAVVAAGALALLHSLTRDQPALATKNSQPVSFFLLSWLLFSIAGAASAGRVHAHYYIQVLPAIALLGGGMLGVVAGEFTSTRIRWRRFGALTLLIVAAWNLTAHPIRGRARPKPVIESGHFPAEYIKAHSKSTDRIAVWGMYPDFYFYADRRPATRFIYTAFQTGLHPGRDCAPDISTDYAIVPGSLEQLVGDLEASRPEFFVDTSFGSQRLFEKYPLHRFPALERFVTDNYREVEAERFRPHGFRVLKLRDVARWTPFALAGGTAAGTLGEPTLQGVPFTDEARQEYRVRAAHSGGRLQRIELLADDVPVDSVTFEPVAEITAIFPVDFGRLGHGTHRLAVRATSANGEVRTGTTLAVEYSTASLPREKRLAFALPRLSLAGAVPDFVQAPYGALVERNGDSLVFFAHAPSIMRYAAPAELLSVSGRFGFRPGAYASDNKGPTDGAEFVIVWISPTGRRVELLRRLLRPKETPDDRGEHAFDCVVPGDGGAVEFDINNGPNGNAASDWTYWTDLRFTTKH